MKSATKYSLNEIKNYNKLLKYNLPAVRVDTYVHTYIRRYLLDAESAKQRLGDVYLSILAHSIQQQSVEKTK